MRFLCLHGYGTDPEFLREMMEPIWEHLPSNWEYEFLAAPMESSKLVIPELDQVPPPNLSWHNYPHPEDIQAALDRIRDFIDSEGPFDGLWGFSQGASMASLLLLEHQKANPGTHDWPFKMVIYNSTFLPYRLDSGAVTWTKDDKNDLHATYEPGEFDASHGKSDVDWKKDEHSKLDYLAMLRVLDKMYFPATFALKYQPEDVPEKISIPSVHVRGLKDEYFFVDDAMYEMFDESMASKMTHRGGHHFPLFPDELVRFSELIMQTAGSII